MKNKIQKLKNENNICKSGKFNIVLDNLEIYYELINKLYDNFELQNKNYFILKNINNEITIKYDFRNDGYIRIFEEPFVRNNKNNFQLIINNEIYKLASVLK